MRQFSSISLKPAAPCGPEGEYVELTGLPRPVPRGLYRLSFNLTADEARRRPLELAYQPQAAGHPRGRIVLDAVFSGRRARATFVLPEAASRLFLHADPASGFAAPVEMRLRRLSSVLANAWALSLAISRRLSRPSRLPELALRAVAALRAGGLAGLLRAVRRAAAADRDSREAGRHYSRWVERQEDRLERDRERLSAQAARLPSPPLISVVMPVFDPPVPLLREAIESVFGQIWPHWQLCIVDDASTDPAVRETIREMTARDERVKTEFRPVNGHICAATNDAISLAAGDWLAFLDQDDRLSPDALLQLALAIDANPDAGIIYSDEDKIGPSGERRDPRFKPDWNIDLFLSYNMVNHLACYRAALVRDAGAMRPGYEGAQDYDLALRVAARLQPGQIVHIPRILYHWRMSPGSVAAGGPAKPYAMPAGERALNDHLRRNVPGAVARLDGNGYRVTYPLPSPPPKVSLIVPTRDRLPLLKKCVESVRRRTDYPDYEIVVVDNGSRQRATLDWLAASEADGAIRVLRDARPFNYSALNNLGVAEARGEIVVLVNNDVEAVSPGWLTEMASLCCQPGVGAVGAKLFYPDGAIQHAGIILNPHSVASHWFRDFPRHHGGPGGRLNVRQRLSAVTGACLATPRRTYLELGGLDEAHLGVAFNDIDYCLKVDRAGLRVVFTPYAGLIHHESASRGKDVTPAKAARLYAEMAHMKTKWGSRLDRDLWGMPGLPAELGRDGWLG